MSHKIEGPDVDARIVRSREAILLAAQHLLTTGGIEALTHSAVALQAGVGRATVYRHWPRSIDLLLETFRMTTFPVLEFGNDSIRAEMTAQLINRLPWFNQAAASALMGSVISTAEFEPEMEELRAVLFEKSINTVVAQFEDARTRGDLVPTASPQTLASLIMGAVFFDRHMLGHKLTEDDIRRIVDTALAGWLPE